MKLISCLFLLVVAATCVHSSYLNLVVTSTLLSNVRSNDEIIGVKTFLTLFTLKKKSKLVDLVKQQTLNGNYTNDHDSNRKLVMEWLKENSISIGVMPSHVNYLTSLFSHFNVSIQEGKSTMMTSSQYFKIYPNFDSCLKRNFLERYDAVLMDPYAFSFFVRFYRDTVSSKNLFESGQMESNNFLPIPLIPYEVYTHRLLNNERSETLNELFHVELLTTCSNQPDVSDAQYIRLLTGYSNFSTQDISIIEKLTSKSSLSANWTLVNSYTPSIISSLSPSTFNLTFLDSALLPSSCYMCKTLTCAGENFDPELDYWIIPQFVIIFGYFIILFGFGLFKKPSMRRRIALPYCPILILTLMVTFTSLSRICVCVFYNISIFVMIWWVFIYSATIVRFYYLRNLYSLITKFPNKEKVMKILASEESGFIFTVLMTCVFALIFNMEGIFFFFNESKATADIVRPIVIVSFVIVGALLGFVVVLWDMIINSKRIRKYGLVSFLVFDDPLYVRVDMLFLIFLIIICMIVVAGNATLDTQQKEFDNVAGILNTILCFVFLLMNGGGVVVIEIYKRIKYAKQPKNNSDDLEIVLKNEDLFNLLREYSEKEFSSENIEMYSQLMKLKEQKYITLKDLEEIDEAFIKNYSKYEVNFPSSCKREFYKLKEQAESKSQIEYSELWQIVGSDLVLNLLDTFKRLQETSNYRKWESVSKYQKHIHP